MSVRASRRSLPDTYFALVKRFPLVHIRDAEHLAAAAIVLDRMLQEERDEGTEAYLDALTDLVEVYERENVPIPDASGADVLRELMAANRLTQAGLGRAVGISQSTISAVLKGKREMTRDQIEAFGRHFGVSPAAFLPR
jgi:HTH-type transcriptional regulator/antitoxin HigA